MRYRPTPPPRSSNCSTASRKRKAADSKPRFAPRSPKSSSSRRSANCSSSPPAAPASLPICGSATAWHRASAPSACAASSRKKEPGAKRRKPCAHSLPISNNPGNAAMPPLPPLPPHRYPHFPATILWCNKPSRSPPWSPARLKKPNGAPPCSRAVLPRARGCCCRAASNGSMSSSPDCASCAKPWKRARPPKSLRKPAKPMPKQSTRDLPGWRRPTGNGKRACRPCAIACRACANANRSCSVKRRSGGKRSNP